MVHKKYKWKNGKRYGPYYYENKRVGDKVVTTYLGTNYNLELKNKENYVGELKNKNRFFYLIAGILLIFAFFFLLYFVGVPPFFSPEIETIEISLDKERYNVGEQIEGELKLSLREGELIPADSKILLSYNGISEEVNLKDIAKIKEINGNYYLAEAKISGEGEGYGLIGEKETYPEIEFEFVVRGIEQIGEVNETDIVEVDGEMGGTGEVGKGEEITEAVPEEGVEESIKDEEEIVSDDIAEEGQETDEQEQAGIEEEQIENIEGVESETTEENNAETGSSADTSEKKGVEVGSETEDSGNTEASVGEPLSEISSEPSTEPTLSPEISFGKVSKENDFVHDLKDGQNVEVIKGSVNINGERVDDEVINLRVENEKAIFSTSYSKIEEGFGEDFLGDEILEIKVNLGEFGLVVENEGIIKAGLLINNETIIEDFREIFLNDDNETLINDTLLNKTLINESLINETIKNETILNETLIETNINNLTQYRAILGQPVKWQKRIGVLAEESFVKVEVPLSAKKIFAKKLDKKGKELEIEDFEKDEIKKINEEGDQIEGEVIDKNLNESFNEAIEGGINNDSIDIAEDVGIEEGSNVREENITEKASESEILLSPEIINGREIDVNVPVNVAQVIIEYETPAPYAVEEGINNGKRVKIVGPEDVHYENVLAFTTLNENLGVVDASKVRIKWVETGEIINVLNANDTDNNSIIDYIEWVVPKLSNQTFEIIVITKAEHLDENRTFISDIYEQVKEKDDVWSETIKDGEYVRVTFEIPLDSTRDITIFPRIVSGVPKIEVYENNGSEIITTFENLINNEYNKVYLTNLQGSQDTFDLRVVGGSLELDHVIDPPGIAKSCNLNGSAGPDGIDCGVTANKNEGTSYATFDSCVDGSSNDYMHIEDIFLDYGSGTVGSTVQVTCQVCCFSSGTEYAIAYHNGTSWRNVQYGNCVSGSAVEACTGLENKTASVVIENTNSFTHYFRCIESFNGVAGMTCNSGTWSDNDDINFTISCGALGMAVVQASNCCSGLIGINDGIDFVCLPESSCATYKGNYCQNSTDSYGLCANYNANGGSVSKCDTVAPTATNTTSGPKDIFLSCIAESWRDCDIIYTASNFNVDGLCVGTDKCETSKSTAGINNTDKQPDTHVANISCSATKGCFNSSLDGNTCLGDPKRRINWEQGSKIFGGVVAGTLNGTTAPVSDGGSPCCYSFDIDNPFIYGKNETDSTPYEGCAASLSAGEGLTCVHKNAFNDWSGINDSEMGISVNSTTCATGTVSRENSTSTDYTDDCIGKDNWECDQDIGLDGFVTQGGICKQDICQIPPFFQRILPENTTFEVGLFNIFIWINVTDDKDNLKVSIYGVNETNTGNFYDNLFFKKDDVISSIASTYNLTTLPIDKNSQNLVALWHLDNNSKYGENNSRVYDFAWGKVNLSAAGNSFPNMTGGKFAGGWVFDGNGDYLQEIGTSGALNGEDNVTFSAWVKRSGSSTTGYETIVQEGSTIGGYSLTTSCNDGLLGFSGRAGSGEFIKTVFFRSVIEDGQWHLITGVYDSSTIYLYVDGVLKNSTDGEVDVGDVGVPLKIGGHSASTSCDGSSSSGSFNGSIDEVAIWNRSLTAKEIVDLYRLKVGKYYWKVNVNDTEGNTREELREFYINDTVNPNVNLINPANGTFTENNLTFFAADLYDIGGLKSATLYVWNTTSLVGTNSTNLNSVISEKVNLSFRLPRDGIYYWNYLANDTFGNSAFNNTNYTLFYNVLTECRFLEKPGTYTQAARIIPPFSPCIIITAQNVTFNGNGFDIANSTFTGTAIYSNAVNTTIKNTNISIASGNGIYFDGVNNGTIQNNIIKGVHWGVYLRNSKSNNILGNVISTNGTEYNYGAYFDNSSLNNINYNNVSTKGTSWANYGIYLSLNSSSNNVSSNTISTNGTLINHGIYLYFSSFNNINSNNISAFGTDTSNSGMKLEFSSSNNISSNAISARGTNYNLGIYLFSSPSNNMNLNNILTSGTSSDNYGIYFFNSSSSNNINSNRINTSGTDSHTFFLQANSSYPSNNNLINNTILDFTGFQLVLVSASINGTYLIDQRIKDYIFVGDGGIVNFKNSQYGEIRFLQAINGSGTNLSNDVRIGNNSVSVNSSGNKGLNKSANITFYNIGERGFLSPVVLRDGIKCPAGVCYNFTALNSSNVSFNVSYWTNYSVGEGIGFVEGCGILNISNMIYTQTARIIPTTSPCINITAQNVTFNGNGFDFVNNTFTGTIFYSNVLNTTIKNTNISIASGNGIYFDGVNNGTIQNNIIKGVHWGVYLSGSRNNNILENVIFTNGTFNNYGISLTSSSPLNNITLNTISTKGTSNNYGIFLSGGSSSSNIINLNNISTSGTANSNYGIYLFSSSNIINLNNISTSGTADNYGLYLYSSSSNNISLNKISTNGTSDNYGIFLYDISLTNNISSNTISTNGTTRNYGIRLSTGASNSPLNNVFNMNTISTNGNLGHVFYFSAGAVEGGFAYPSGNNLINNTILKFAGAQLFFASASINGTYLIDQPISNYSFAGTGSLVNFKNSQYGEIRFLQAINGSGTNLSNDVRIGNNSVSVNSSGNKGLNKSANITFYNIGERGFLSPVVLRDGIKCPAGVCYNFTSLNVSEVKFNVTYWTNYSVGDISNNPPNNPNTKINSTDGSNKTKQDLHCFDTITDADNNTMNVSVMWYNSSVLKFQFDYNDSYVNGTLFIADLGNENTTKGENWSCALRLFDGFGYSNWVNSTNLTILNTLPNVTLINPSNGNITMDRTPNFTWFVNDDDNDTISSEFNLTCYPGCSNDNRFAKTSGASNVNVSYEIVGDLQKLKDNNFYYNWSVRANDSETGFSPWTDDWKIEIQAFVAINFTWDKIEFGIIGQNGNNDTTDDSPPPFILENIGNVFVNATIYASDLWPSAKNPSMYYQFKIDNKTGEGGAFLWGISITEFRNMTNITSPLLAIAQFNYSDLTDEAEIDINVTVPSTEGAGVRNSTVVVTAELGE